MKNIHVLPTDKPSRLQKFINYVVDKIEFELCSKAEFFNKGQHIYITNDEEIKDGDWHLNIVTNKISKYNIGLLNPNRSSYKKIILTTDLQLIADGVQAITDDFLEWFVKNPSCESVEVKEKQHFEFDKSKRINPLNGVYYSYKIIIPKEEPKQETLEEAVNAFKKTNVYTNEIKQEQERSYSEEEVEKMVRAAYTFGEKEYKHFGAFKEWFEQFKKK